MTTIADVFGAGTDVVATLGYVVAFGLVGALFASVVRVANTDSRGATARITSWLMGVMGVIFLGNLWLVATGVREPYADVTPSEFNGMWIGLTIGPVAFLACRWLISRRREPVLSAPHEVERLPRWYTTPVRLLDYLFGALVCGLMIVAGSAASVGVREELDTWIIGLGSALAFVLSHAAVMVAGIVYSQGVSAGAIRAMNAALARDWSVGRGRHYFSLVPPFLLPLYAATEAPGLLVGVLMHFVTLAACWRWTTGRPLTALQLAKVLRERSRSPERPVVSSVVGPLTSNDVKVQQPRSSAASAP